MDMISEHLHRFFATCHPPSPSSYTCPRRPPYHHHRHPEILTSNPYITVSISVTNATIASSRIIPNSQDPKWTEHFKMPLARHSPCIVFHVKDNDIFSAELISTVSIPAAPVTSGNLIHDWYRILSPFGKPPKPETALLISLQYRPIDENPIYVHGIVDDLEKLGMRDTYFPVQKGGSVMLYQDAHVMVGKLPAIELEK